MTPHSPTLRAYSHAWFSSSFHPSQDLKLLADKFKSIAAQSGNPNTIVLSQLPEALEAVGIVEKDKTLLAKVFSLMDASGDGQVRRSRLEV